MEWVIISAACIAALGIAWSDFKMRAIHIGWFGLLAASGAIYQWMQADPLFFSSFGFNLLCIGFMLGSILLIYRLKGQTQVMDHLLGWGDVAMLLVLSVWLPPLHFLLVFTFTSIVLILIALLMQATRKVGSDFPIPLAGALGLGFMLGLLMI